MPRETAEVQLAFGLRVRELRKAKHLTQEAVAQRLKMLTPNYARYERGGLNVTRDTIVRIANALEVEPIELFRAPRTAKKR
jgi:transcriptional regulator with XRE-family HTH domain